MDIDSEELLEANSFPVVSPFSISWSENNIISVITCKGIVTFEYKPDLKSTNNELRLYRTSFSPKRSLPVKKTLINNRNNAILWKSSKQEFDEFVTDNSYSTHLEYPQIHEFVFIQCEISPMFVSSDRTDYFLATLTNYGCLTIHEKKNYFWDVKIDISEIWTEHCAENWDEGEENFLLLKTRVDMLKITNLCWCKRMIQNKLLLVTAHQNGDIVFWEVDKNYNAHISFTFQTKELKPTCVTVLFVQEHKIFVVFVGFMNGFINVYLVRNGKVIHDSKIWMLNDDIKVNNIYLYESDKNFTMFACKRHVFYAVNFNVEKCDSNFRIVVNKTQLIQFETQIMSVIGNRLTKLLTILLLNTKLLTMTTEENKDGIVRIIDEKSSPRSSESFYSYGAACSYNNSFICFIYVPKLVSIQCGSHKMAETTKLVFYKLNMEFKTTPAINGFILKTIKQSEHCRLSMYSDLLDLKRLLIINKSIEVLEKVFNDKLNILELKMLYWEWSLLHCLNQSDETLEVVDKFRKKILEEFYLRRLEYLSNKFDISKVERQNIRRIQNYLGLSKDSRDEKCLLCGQVITESNFDVEICVNKHKFSRCVVSLQPCLPPYSTCQLCNSIVNNSQLPANDFVCPLCDGVCSSELTLKS